ncbi:MAG: acetyl-CoA carboxylase biotin carboxylase subunit [Candidatus Koribacter versatilis]|uniref:Acetyl-CoA carboxylase biotin carboxylase subunit n=1 Tax=Candidatus Korobacter versatilis TaxID=658062 RepID=A0A932A8E6_9BACT|nr:acetyl-CoA carboxylase biotin carboxylase subunit [Candidatus Koribacter versatilis]
MSVSPKPPFKKVLVANRGEIAVRIIRACRELGIASVAVYSDVDRGALHVRRALEAYPIGPAAASESYLRIDKLIDVAKKSGADAIHPGYGFLSENASFARACRDAGIKFIGPTPEAMELMGSKTSARQAMQQAGVPFVPGSAKGLATIEEARRVAAEVGYPLMLKAAAGGGGKGMRLVRSEKDLPAAYDAAQSEAERAFKNSEVYIEKLIEDPRHVEVQIFGDEHGSLLYLGERECSIQRRHQKVVEESPSPIVNDEMRRRMGEVAVRVGRAAGYTNAGTVEFLVDKEKDFYFLEMNTRLQVEHPVTEFVTGLDLVHLQMRVAAGEKLPFRQEDVQLRGHAIECRVYAEDPENNFLPSPGRIQKLTLPSGPGVRNDSGMYEGWTVPLDYDPLLAKLIAHAPTRAQAAARLERALSEYFVGGIRTNLSLFRAVLRHPDFIAGRLATGFLDRMLAGQAKGAAEDKGNGEHAMIAAIAAAIFESTAPAANGTGAKNGAPNDSGSAWKKTARQEALRNE